MKQPKHQQVKEEAVKLGINRGLALFSRGDLVIARSASGEEKVLAKASDSYQKWQDALKALSADEPQIKGQPARQKVLKIYTDGGSRGNPGPSASGYVIMAEDDQVLEEGGEYLGITTNNQAEYQAVRLALNAARKYQPQTLEFYLDSLLVVNQMNGVYKIKNRDLWPIYSDIKKLAENFKEVKFKHVGREFNKLADAKVNEVLDGREA